MHVYREHRFGLKPPRWYAKLLDATDTITHPHAAHALRNIQRTGGDVDPKLVELVARQGTTTQARKLIDFLLPSEPISTRTRGICDPFRQQPMSDRTAGISISVQCALTLAAEGIKIPHTIFDAVMGKTDSRIWGSDLAALLGAESGVSAEDALQLADEQNRVIASNMRLDNFLADNPRAANRMSCWTGTLVGYEEPGKSFGRFINWVDPMSKKRYILPVPPDFQGFSDAILVIQHPDFKLIKDRKNVFVLPLGQVSLIKNSPARNGSYPHDLVYCLPASQRASRVGEHRAFHMLDKFVGLVARSHQRHIYLYVSPSDHLSVLVEASGKTPS